jgi:hypothetical protein
MESVVGTNLYCCIKSVKNYSYDFDLYALFPYLKLKILVLWDMQRSYRKKYVAISNITEFVRNIGTIIILNIM